MQGGELGVWFRELGDLVLTRCDIGGGYVLPASEFMVDFMFQVVEVLNKKGKNAACLFLAYGTPPSLSLLTHPPPQVISN